MTKPPKNTVIIEGDGDRCPRCEGLTEIREHARITEKELGRPFYYSRWFNCINPDCRTTLIMPERFKVFNDPRAQQESLAVRLAKAQGTHWEAPDDDQRIMAECHAQEGPPPWEVVATRSTEAEVKHHLERLSVKQERVFARIQMKVIEWIEADHRREAATETSEGHIKH